MKQAAILFFIIFLGITRLIIFYGAFGISIVDFLDISEVLDNAGYVQIPLKVPGKRIAPYLPAIEFGEYPPCDSLWHN